MTPDAPADLVLPAAGDTLQVFVTVQDAADSLGIRPGSVRAAIRRGTLPAYRFGERIWVIDREDVETYRATSQRRREGS